MASGTGTEVVGGDAAMAGIQIQSPAFNENELIPGRHAHDRDNVSPTLRWSDVPDGATELVLMCEDPDAPSGLFLHWLVTGIDPASTGVDEGQVPSGGRQWPNGFGEVGWGGPQPPVGDNPHRYVFRLYALGQPIVLPAKATARDVHRQVDDAALADGSTVGRYQR
jgi:Raf kinase inhibitor-like YbhB/YbcL family protein